MTTLRVSSAGGGDIEADPLDTQNPKSVSFDLLLTDYFSHSTFPLKVSSSGSALDLEAAFSSPARLTDLITLYRLNILQPLIPGLRKDGYTELPASATPNASSSSGAGARVGSPQGPYYPDSDGPLMGVPGRGGGMAFPPSRGGGGGDDPLRIPGSGGRGVGAPNPHDIGRSDLLPLGGMGGTFGSAGPGSNPFGGGLGGAIGGGGMMMGRDEFRNRFGGGDGTVGGRGPWGGDGYLPPMGAPPGARFDPVGPSGGVSCLLSACKICRLTSLLEYSSRAALLSLEEQESADSVEDRASAASLALVEEAEGRLSDLATPIGMGM